MKSWNFKDTSYKSASHEAHLVLILINLKDTLAILNNFDRRIAFKDDLPDDQDVTDVVFNMRNAVCHIGFQHRRIDNSGNYHSFSRVIGGGGIGQIGGKILADSYPDDVAFYYGEMRIILKRHIKKALECANIEAQEIAQESGYKWFPIR